MVDVSFLNSELNNAMLPEKYDKTIFGWLSLTRQFTSSTSI